MTDEQIKREAEKKSREVAQDWYDRIRPTVSPGEFKALELAIENAIVEAKREQRNSDAAVARAMAHGESTQTGRQKAINIAAAIASNGEQANAKE